MLRKLIVEENYLKGYIEVLKLIVLNFDEQVKEVVEALTMLKY